MSLRLGARFLLPALPALILASRPLDAAVPLFESLEAFGGRLKVGDPDVESTWEGGTEGPKGIAAGDLDGDGDPDIAVANLDGTVTVYLNDGRGRFGGPLHLRTGAFTLREIIIADLTGEGLPDIAACALEEGFVMVFPNCRAFPADGLVHDPPIRIQTWRNARNLTAGDFDGCGKLELAVAGPGAGLMLYKWSAGSFRKLGGLADLVDLEAAFDVGGGSSKPVFSLKAFRPKGSARDELLMTHARSGMVLVLAAGPAGRLESWCPLAGILGAYDLDAAPLYGQAAEARADLVTVHRDQGTIQVRRGKEGPERFEGDVSQTLEIPGAPRAARIIDLDGDGWNDLVVVVRDYDLVLTFRNEAGTLVPGSEMPVGQSPRDLAAADFNGDGQNDVAVINRMSGDVSILTACLGEAGFSALDHLYLVESEASDLVVQDLNLDGRDDVIQLHRASGQVSVRLARDGGVLGYAGYYPMGSLPNALRAADVNGDGKPDLITANLGVEGIEVGSVSVRLGDGTGDLGKERSFGLPSEGRLYSLDAADFDGDGKVDLASGFLDYRIGFFKNTGGGSGCSFGEWGCGFAFAGTCDFIHEAGPELVSGTAIKTVVGDFDKDGDLDLAAAGWAGDLIVLENRGDFLLGSPDLARKVYRPSIDMFGTRDLRARDLNGDGDLDLIVTSENGALVYLGAAGMDFVLSPEALPESGLIRSSSAATADFDGDGDPDIALSGRIFSCVTVLSNEGGKFIPALSIDVPAGRLIATGDVDGDGMPDLVGSGGALWIALSGIRPIKSAPLIPEGDGRRIEGPVINEFLASNGKFPIQPSGRTWEFLEIFNGAPAEVDLKGYRLVLAKQDPEVLPQEYLLDTDTVVKSGGYLLLFCTRDAEPLHTGFKLPIEGGILTLLDAQGKEVDRVEYPAQRPDVAFGRWRDGFWSFAFKEIPSPGSANLDYGPTRPSIKLEAVVPDGWTFDEPVASPLSGKPVRFFARGWDDVGIVSVRLFYGSKDTPGSKFKSIYLFDDGKHGDGGLQDGLFSGVLPGGFPSGGGGCIAVEIDPLDGDKGTDPEDPDPGEIGEGRGSYCLEDEPPPELEILEIVSSNIHGLVDDTGTGRPDWVEVGNVSETAEVALKGIYLGEQFPANRNWYGFPETMTLKPKESLVVYCDGRPGQGDRHAPFELSAAEGGQLVLVSGDFLGPRTAYTLIQAVKYPSLPSDVAWARMQAGWGMAEPTPGMENPLAAARPGDVDRSGGLDITDGIAILSYLYLGRTLECLEAADVNQDSLIDITDVIYLMIFLYLGGGSPSEMPVNCS